MGLMLSMVFPLAIPKYCLPASITLISTEVNKTCPNSGLMKQPRSGGQTLLRHRGREKKETPNLQWLLPTLIHTKAANSSEVPMLTSLEIEGLFNKEQREVEVRIMKDAVCMLKPRLYIWITSTAKNVT